MIQTLRVTIQTDSTTFNILPMYFSIFRIAAAVVVVVSLFEISTHKPIPEITGNNYRKLISVIEFRLLHCNFAAYQKIKACLCVTAQMHAKTVCPDSWLPVYHFGRSTRNYLLCGRIR